jgi:uncharacterized radical SAM protein YgiQ
MNHFLPMTPEEVKSPLDIILVTGDAYVDHSSFGIALIGRWLEAHGYRVGIIAQPDWTSPEAFKILGKPRLFFGVTSGNMDSMVNLYTAARRVRNDDAYSPGGKPGMRPERACIAYSNRIKQAYPGIPVVLGGIEASLRRMTHYDYWQNRLRRSILLDAKADLLVYGMGERAVVEIARMLKEGKGIEACRTIRGTAWAAGKKDTLPEDVQELPSYEACVADPLAFNRSTLLLWRETNPACALPLLQRHGDRAIYQNPPAENLNQSELDRLYELPYLNAPHPCYREPIPAFAAISTSITINRGCAGGCSFCALTIHQGKDVVSRSEASVLREAKALSREKGFNGVISDMGGPTANMFQMHCTSPEANAVCRRVSCLHPVRCKHYGTDHQPFKSLLKKVRELPGMKRVFVNSGIRYDLASLDKNFVEELTTHHVSGTLTTAPEHVSAKVLRLMRKPEIEHFSDFMKRFKATNLLNNKRQFLVPYFQCAHPGCGPNEAIELALYMKKNFLKCRQVQMFIPTPGTLSTAMYVSGHDPHSKEPVYVARTEPDRARQRALMFWWKQEEWPAIREALIAYGRRDLIGHGAEQLVPPGPVRAGWKKGNRPDGGMGMQVERASRAEEQEEKWEGSGC